MVKETALALASIAIHCKARFESVIDYFLDDVMKLVDGERINLVLTDPPYGINVINQGKGPSGTIGAIAKNKADPWLRSGKSRTRSIIVFCTAW